MQQNQADGTGWNTLLCDWQPLANEHVDPPHNSNIQFKNTTKWLHYVHP